VPVPDVGTVVRSLVRVEAATYVLSEALGEVVGYTPAGVRASENNARAVRAAAQIIRQAYPVSFGHALPGLNLIADQALDAAELPCRVRAALSSQGIHDWGGLAGCGVQYLLEIPNLGMGAVRLITEAAVWRVAVIAAGEMAGSFVREDPAPVKSQTLPGGCIAIPLQALAAWAIAERGMVMVGDLLALGPEVTGLLADVAREWELARNLDLRWLAAGPAAMPQLPGLLDELLNEVDERRREILARRTFAPQPETLDALAADLGCQPGTCSPARGIRARQDRDCRPRCQVCAAEVPCPHAREHRWYCARSRGAACHRPVGRAVWPVALAPARRRRHRPIPRHERYLAVRLPPWAA
jgi:hypothetical protein